MGEVGPGKLEDRGPDNGYVCVFDFKVSGVPTGQGFYKVTVEGQGAKEVSEVDLKSGTFTVNTTKLQVRILDRTASAQGWLCGHIRERVGKTDGLLMCAILVLMRSELD